MSPPPRPFVAALVAVALAVLFALPTAEADAKTKRGPPVAVAPWSGFVARIVDGDTLTVRPASAPKAAPVKIRLAGIDCPESKVNARCKRLHGAGCKATLPAGKAATAEARKLAPVGSAVTVQPVRPFRDKYGRALADVVLPGGADLGAAMLARGCSPYKARR